MVCFIAFIPLLVRSRTGDFDKAQEAIRMSKGLVGMRGLRKSETISKE
jgi:hypothetical protein